jgi:hypothetical protein
MPTAPASHIDLLESPTFAHLATVRPAKFVAVRCGLTTSEHADRKQQS